MYKRQPFDVIEKAVDGEPEAIELVLQHYSPRIKYLSKYRGDINDDIQDRLKTQLILSLIHIEMCIRDSHTPQENFFYLRKVE